MVDKYYTPDITEFHVGFEYERMNGDHWEEAELTERDMYASYSNEGEENEFEEISMSLRTVRVKYIDKADIEELGFGGYIPPHEYDHTWSRDSYTLKAWFNNKVPVVRIIHITNTIIFHGNIKNKSELKVLLKQLGI